MANRRRIALWCAALLALVVTAALAAAPARRLYKATKAARRLRTGDERSRGKALRELAKLRLARADRLVTQALQDPAPSLRAAAAYAIFRAKRKDLAGLMLEASQREQVGRIRCDMLYYWAQLAGPSCEARLSELLGSEDSWTALGAAMGLLRRGQKDAVGIVFAFAALGEPQLKKRAQAELQALIHPMATLIGQPLPAGLAPGSMWSAQHVAAVEAWWKVHVTRRLLSDWLAWKSKKPYYWMRVRLLQHEWDKHAGDFLRTARPAAPLR